MVKLLLALVDVIYGFTVVGTNNVASVPLLFSTLHMNTKDTELLTELIWKYVFNKNDPEYVSSFGFFKLATFALLTALHTLSAWWSPGRAFHQY